MRLITAIAATMSLGVILIGCASTTAGGLVGVSPLQLLLVPANKPDQLAAENYSQLQSEATSNGTLNQDRAMLRRVRTIVGRIEPQTRVFRTDAPDWGWEVNIITSAELNAFCMPGGKIIVYSGLIDQLQLSDAELAIVLGHEIAHALRAHVRKQMSQAMAAQEAVDLFDISARSADAASGAYQLLGTNKFNRTDENEADRIGLELTARAGYDPRAGITLWQKMIDAGRGTGKPPEFISSHPTDTSRVQVIQGLLPTVMPLYEAGPQARK